ncbi:MAG TPA: ABC transporter permease [Feifaniaceae bacterium]|nr:ABC transporter permease [Feifaniaceae bacterium]
MEQNKAAGTLNGAAFLPDDFELIGGEPEAQIDSGFSGNTYWKDVLERFVSNKGAVVALIVILIIVLFAVIGPAMTGYSYSSQNLSQKNLAPRIPGLEDIGIFNGDESLHTTSGDKIVNGYRDKELTDVYYWFGSDTLGRDIWTRVWEGARVSLGIAVVSAFINMTLGMCYGLISGYYGGWVDNVMQRFAEINNSIPRLVIVTLLLLVLKPGFLTIVLALVITDWISMSRIARAEMLKLKEQEFVLASHTLGASGPVIIFKEILPNIIGQIITQLMFSIPTAIFTEAFLSFVGLGIPVPQCSLGSLISDAFNSFTTHPYQIVPPILVLALLMLCFNVLADGLREAFDPKLKEM